MTLHRDSPATTADELLEQLFLDNVEVWSTLISSAVGKTGDASAADDAGACASEARTRCPLTSANPDAFASAMRARARLTRWVGAQSCAGAPAPSLPRWFARAGVAW